MVSSGNVLMPKGDVSCKFLVRHIEAFHISQSRSLTLFCSETGSHPGVQLLQRYGMGWKVLLYSCPHCEFDNALDDLGIPWVGGTKLPPDGTEGIRSQPTGAQGVVDDSLDASKPMPVFFHRFE